MPVSKVEKEQLFFEHQGVRYAFVRWSLAKTDDGNFADASHGGAARLGDAKEIAGASGENQAVPVVLLHGFSQRASSWDEIAPCLASDRTVYALDLVGHGASDKPSEATAYSLGAQAGMLEAFLMHVGEESCPPVVVGYSMGGRVALVAACRNPQVFSGLVLESAGLGPATKEEGEAALERDRANAARLRREGLVAFMDAWEQLPLFATQQILPQEVRDRIRRGRLANSVEALVLTFEYAGQGSMPVRADMLPAVASFPFPLRYVCGQRDSKYHALSDAFLDISSVKVDVVEGAGHNVHLEAPAAFLRVLKSYLKA